MSGRLRRLALFLAVMTVWLCAAPYAHAGPCVRIELSPSAVNGVVGAQHNFVARGFDASGNDASINNPRWTTSGGGTLAPTGTTCSYTATGAGDFTITCTEQGTAIQGTATIQTVSPPPLTTIEVSPSAVNTEVGQDRMFSASGKDPDGNDCPITNPIWETSGGGTLAPNGTTCTYTATGAGDFTITCTEQGTAIQGTASIHTTEAPAAPIARIIITPSLARLRPGQTQTFQAFGLTRGLRGQLVPLPDVQWRASGGTLTPNGATCEFSSTRRGMYTITATLGRLRGSALVFVLWR